VVVIFIAVVVVTEENATAADAEDAVYLIETEIDQGVDFSSKHSHFILGLFWYYLFLINWGLLIPPNRSK